MAKASRTRKDGQLDKRFKSTSGCALYFLILLGVVAFFVGGGYLDNAFYSGWLEIIGYTVVGTILIYIIWKTAVFESSKQEKDKVIEDNIYMEQIEVDIKSKTTALLLCFFLGVIGMHRFYLGHTLIGIIQLLTFGGFVFWTLIDFFRLIFGSLKVNPIEDSPVQEDEAENLEAKQREIIQEEKEVRVQVSSKPSGAFILFFSFVISFIIVLAVGIYLEKEWVVLKDIQNFVKNL